MTEAFSFNREFDFVRLDGLRRATGCDPHEWDIYIIKELVDNALDADEVMWRKDSNQFPHVSIRVEYYEALNTTQLHIEISNRAEFPVEKIQDIFDTHWYTSRKAFDKGLTRGALGNALKTLLGIPLALFAKTGDGYKPFSTPLSIDCKGVRYLPRYVVNGKTQEVRISQEQKKISFSSGTKISVNLDHFWQERPRTLIEIKRLAEKYRLCNPHAEFAWDVEVFGKVWSKTFPANNEWLNKFKGKAQVEWYSLATFRDLLGALYRKQCSGEKDQLPIDSICRCFSGFDGKPYEAIQDRLPQSTIIEAFKSNTLKASEIEGKASKRLYSLLCKRSPTFDPFSLGFLGYEHIMAVLTDVFSIEGELLYEIDRDVGNDPSVPFVIEASVGWLKEGRRQVWTALNFTPGYEDPFLTRWLNVSNKPEEQVLGLRGMLDAYDLQDDSPLIFFLHLVCPNVEHSEFSKTEVNHLPFREALGSILDRLFTRLKHLREEEELKLEQTVVNAVDTILARLDLDEKFTLSQLLERVRLMLGQDPALALWLETPSAVGRLQTYITQYESAFMQRVARLAAGVLSIPIHPDRHISILTEQVSRDFLRQYQINKILFIQTKELESVVIENHWLTRMDLALLHNVSDPEALRQSLLHCVNGSDLPVLILRDNDDTGLTLLEQMREWLIESEVYSGRIVDLGLSDAAESSSNCSPTKLVSLMPNELADYTLNKFIRLGFHIKSRPFDDEIRRDLTECFDHLLKGHLWEGLSQELDIVRLLKDIDGTLGFTELMIEQQLDNKLKNQLEDGSCADSYPVLLNNIVEKFFIEFMREQSVKIQRLIEAHVSNVRRGRA